MFNLLNRNYTKSWNKELRLLTFYKITYSFVNLPLPNNIFKSHKGQPIEICSTAAFSRLHSDVITSFKLINISEAAHKNPFKCDMG